MTFYLGRATSVALDTQPGLQALLEPKGDGSWALLDTALVRQDKNAAAELSRLSAAWVLVQSFPSTLSLPVLLDIEPASASAGAVDTRVELRLTAPETGRGHAMSPRPPVSLWPDPNALGTLTDLYELTMMAGYHAAGMVGQKACFEMFVRKMPPGRAYLVFAGLEQAIGDLLKLAFDPRADRRDSPLAGIPPRRSRRHGQAGPNSV